MAAAAAAITPYTPPATLNDSKHEELPVGKNFNTNNIGKNEHLVMREIGPYTMRLIVSNSDGLPRRIRKVATTNYRPGHHHATLNEIRVYRHLMRVPGAKEHILPFYGAARGSADNWVYLNFKYVDGEDFEQYLASRFHDKEAHTSEEKVAETKQLLISAAKHLKWLLEAGGYSHGDIKLNNFYRGSDGKTYVIDFGKARDHLERIQLINDIRDFIKMMEISEHEKTSLLHKLIRDADSQLKETGAVLQRETSETTREQKEQIIKDNQNYNRQYGVIIYDRLISYLSTGMVGGRRKTRNRRFHRKSRRTTRKYS